MKRLVLFLTLLCAQSAFAQTNSIWFATSSDTTTGTGAATFVAPMGMGANKNATESSVYGLVASPGTIQGFAAQTLTDPTAAHQFDITLSVSAVLQTQTCSLVGGAGLPLVCSDYAHAVHVNAGDTVSYKIVGTAGSASGRITITVKFTSDNTGETNLSGNSNGNLTATSPSFGSLIGNGVLDGTTGNDSKVWIVSSANGTITKGCVKLLTSTTVAGTRTFTLMKNSTVTMMVIAFDLNDAAGAVKCDSVHTVHIVPLDTLSWQSEFTLLPQASRAAFGAIFVGDTVGDFLVPSMSQKSLDTATTYYNPLGQYDDGAASFPLTTETSHRNIVSSDMAMKGVCVKLSTATGAGTYTFINRVNTGIQLNNLQFKISAAADSGCYSSVGTPTEIFYNTNDLVTTRVTPAGGPTAARAAITYTGTMTFSCANNYVLVDHGSGVAGAAVTAAAIDPSTFGVAGANAVVTTGNETITFETTAHHDVGGTFPAQCNNVWPGNGNSTVGQRVLMTTSPGTATYTRVVMPTTTVLGTIVANVWFKTDALSTYTIQPDIFTIFGASGTNFVNAGVVGNGGGLKIYMETPGDMPSGCSGNTSTGIIPVQPNTWYLLALRYGETTAKNHEVQVYNENLSSLGIIQKLSCFNQTPISVAWGFIASTTTNTGYSLYHDKPIFRGAFNEVCPATNLLLSAATSASKSKMLRMR